LIKYVIRNIKLLAHERSIQLPKISGKTYEGLVEASETKEILQPRTMKELKFVSHALGSLNNFALELPTYLKTLENLTAEENHAELATSYLHKLTDSRFKLNLSFIRDVLTLLSVFSKTFQLDSISLNDYTNNVALLKACLESIDLDDCKKHLPNYFFQKNCTDDVHIPPVKTLRSFMKKSNESASETVLHEYKNIISNIIHSVVKQFEERPRQAELIAEGSALLNDLCEDFINNVDSIYICAHCSAKIALSSVGKHYKLAHKGKELEQRLITYDFRNFVFTKKVNFLSIAGLLPAQVRKTTSPEHLLTEYQQFKEVFNKATLAVKEKNLKPKLQSVMKCFFSQEYVRQVPKTISMLILRLVTTPVSEAVCESFGSVMEEYHKRFTHSDIDDEQVQKEMFLSLVGPPPNTPAAESLIRKTVARQNNKHVLSEYARFYKLGGKVMYRLENQKYSFPFRFS
jgi:hypothetical protein